MDTIFGVIGTMRVKNGPSCAFRWRNPESDPMETGTYYRFASDVCRFVIFMKTEYPDVEGNYICCLHTVARTVIFWGKVLQMKERNVDGMQASRT